MRSAEARASAFVAFAHQLAEPASSLLERFLRVTDGGSLRPSPSRERVPARPLQTMPGSPGVFWNVESIILKPVANDLSRLEHYPARLLAICSVKGVPGHGWARLPVSDELIPGSGTANFSSDFRRAVWACVLTRWAGRRIWRSPTMPWVRP